MTLDERERRYLRIQKELGGNELILSDEAVGQSSGPAAVVETPSTASSAPTASSVRPPDRPPDRPTAWQKGAPAIPTTSGINVSAPERSLMDIPHLEENLDEVAAAIAACRKCFLCEGRTHTVPGEGSPSAGLMFVGEGPGQVEDETGRPFVGRAGELLNQIIQSVGLKREEVFIANAVKCRPPGNRKPLPDEIAACMPYLERQIELLRPRVLVALGATAAEALLQVRRSLADLRGRVHSYRGIPLVVTYHPAALLRNPNWKKPTWDDIRIARQLLDR